MMRRETITTTIAIRQPRHIVVAMDTNGWKATRVSVGVVGLLMGLMMDKRDIREGIAREVYAFHPYVTAKRGLSGIRKLDWDEVEDRERFYATADEILSYLHKQGVVRKVERELPLVCELEPDVDAYFGQEVCCEILPKYIQDAGSVSNKCYRDIIGLAYDLAYTIGKIQRDFNAKAGYVATASLIDK